MRLITKDELERGHLLDGETTHMTVDALVYVLTLWIAQGGDPLSPVYILDSNGKVLEPLVWFADSSGEDIQLCGGKE